MCVIAPHVTIIINVTHQPTYITYFGWGINLLDGLYVGI